MDEEPFKTGESYRHPALFQAFGLPPVASGSNGRLRAASWDGCAPAVASIVPHSPAFQTGDGRLFSPWLNLFGGAKV